MRPLRGRGAISRPPGRFQQQVALRDADGNADPVEDPADEVAAQTELTAEQAGRIISYNRSPDIPFDRSINPYRGCEHGCIYCYARATHAYLDLSPGLDFETRIRYKANAATQLRAALQRPGYRPAPIALGVNTDAWQPAEKRHGLTREILEVLLEYRHPVTVITKSGLIERDLDLLGRLAELNLVHASVSVTTLDADLHRRLEPRAAGPGRRLRIIERLAAAGIPTGVMLAPLIPAINEHELEAILEAAADRGAQVAGYVALRLPYEVSALFEEWLRGHYPERADKVVALVRALHDGQDGGGDFGRRLHGRGPVAELLRQRFRLARRRLGLQAEYPGLDLAAFRPPSAQLSLFAGAEPD